MKFTFKYGIRIGITDISIIVVPILWLGINFSSLTAKNKCFGINSIILSLNFIYTVLEVVT